VRRRAGGFRLVTSAATLALALEKAENGIIFIGRAAASGTGNS